jgi:uncharacterized LabA/DUF88 family protein
MSNDLCIFVDGNNIFHSAMQASVQIDYTKLLRVLTEDKDYLKAVFYTGFDDNADKHRSFLHWMTRNGWRVIKKPVKTENGTRRARLEVEIATDMVMSVLNGAKTIILVSGDEDFAYPLSKIQDRDVRVIVAGYRNAMSNRLLDVADEFIELDQVDIAKDVD